MVLKGGAWREASMALLNNAISVAGDAQPALEAESHRMFAAMRMLRVPPLKSLRPMRTSAFRRRGPVAQRADVAVEMAPSHGGEESEQAPLSPSRVRVQPHQTSSRSHFVASTAEV